MLTSQDKRSLDDYFKRTLLVGSLRSYREHCNFRNPNTLQGSVATYAIYGRISKVFRQIFRQKSASERISNIVQDATTH